MRTDPRSTKHPDPALAQAIEWMVLLHSGQANSKEKAAFESWRTQNPSHGAACQRVEGAFSAFTVLRERGVSGSVANQSVQGLSRRSVMRATLSVAGLSTGLSAGLLGWQVANQQGLMADQYTGVAQRQQQSLPDGSTLTLDARTALDMTFGQGRRTLMLRHGRVLITAAASPTHNPLQIHTSLGQVSVEAGQFMVQLRRDSELLRVTPLKGQVTVASAEGAPVQVAAGKQAQIARKRAPTVVAARGTEALWTRGLIAMDNQPLGELIEALRDYRPGMLRVDPHAAQIRISGVFSLDDTERTLRVLSETQPVHVTTRTPYWVTIESA